MRTSDHILCESFPCGDVDAGAYIVPAEDIDPGRIRIVMISEAAPVEPADYFYAPGDPSYMKPTLMAFRDAGADVVGMGDIVSSGVYITTAVKCAKTHYTITARTIQDCSLLLEKEIALFPQASVFLLMGDTAIKAINYITKRQEGVKAIPDGSTYKIRKREFSLNGRRYFPSYLMTGGNYLIEKSKRRMIAEDIREALRISDINPQ